MKRSELKQMIKEIIDEIDFKSQDEFEKYKATHKMRPTTKVSIGGKETTAGDASHGDDKKSGNDKNTKLLKKLSTLDVSKLPDDKKQKIKKQLEPLTKIALPIADKLVDHEDAMASSRRELSINLNSLEKQREKRIADKYGFDTDYDDNVK